MRVDPVLRDLTMAVKQLLLAMDNRLTAIENFAPEGSQGQVLTSNGPNIAPSYQTFAGGGGAVTSVFGRTGAVVAAMGDYGFNQISGKPTTLAGYGIIDAYTITEIDNIIAALTPADLVGWPANAAGVLTNDGAGLLTWAAAAAMALDDLTDVDAAAPSDGDVLTFDVGSGNWIPVAPSAGSLALDDLTDVNAPTPADGDVLTWDDTAGEWIAAAPGAASLALDDLTDVNAPTPSTGDVLTFDGAEWINQAPTGGLQDRDTVNHTTASVASGSTVQNVIDIGYSAALLMSLEADIACRVRLYSTSSARAADLARTDSTDPAAGIGVLCEYIFTGSEVIGAEPPIILKNMDGSPTNEIYYAIENRSGSTDTIALVLTILPMEN